MSQPRYQIFVSSTFKDLQEERQAVLNAILKLNQFPAGMEIFPAANETPWEVIEDVIKDSDYYVLIIGGKYGSMDETGISYTEKEYDFAVSQGIPILAFPHAEPENIPIGKSETDTKIRKKLDAFKTKVHKHTIKTWKTISELQAEVVSSLSMNIIMKPRPGWIRADGINKTKLLEQLAELQNRYDNLLVEHQKLKDSALIIDSETFSFGNELVVIEFEYHSFNFIFSVEITWEILFLEIAEFILSKSIEDVFKGNLQYIIYEYYLNTPSHCETFLETGKKFHSGLITITEDSFKMIRNQFLALGLIESSDIVVTKSDSFHSYAELETAWQLTEKGRKLYLQQKAIRRE